MHRVAAVLVIVFMGLVPLSVAHAQIGPNVPTPLTQDPQPPPAPPAKFEDKGLSTFQKVLIFGAAALILVAIATVIVRDARRAAPVDERSRRARSHDHKGASSAARAARERERQQRAKKAKAKAARNQRKRNRPQ
jgi:hypothetical protein